MSKWRPHTTGIVIGGLVLILVALVASYASRNFQPSSDLRLGSGVFTIQVATTDAARIQGLSGVDSLNANQGLLMVFPSDDTWGIWMKDMKVPLDIIWMNNEKKVIYMVTDASPDLGTTKTFKPKDSARYVLEVPSGTVKNAGIQVGSLATFTVVGSQ
ncbi:MAG: DUF192 domain-containing protein [Candidatus Microsaccharimonas sossegonensis]|uniref:DUF192 domain-containing protein n=1 Tax=Candidatus Microsaccharimonas sossegonensis TaxID=2506948 RepID=A0A4Q0AI14_9BACT|nr:MAG: DUF192 domain-containing protein [Candidatus Microsaccharimonas sossegonensis]